MKTNASGLFIILLAAGSLCLPRAAPCDEKAAGWPAEVEKALDRAGANRPELVKALTAVPPQQRKGMVFLVANMPDSDLRSLRADFLLDNVALAYRARGEVPWGARIPDEVFLNDVLPYANLDEPRDPWRKQLHEMCLPLVKDCKTPAEAAHRLNSAIFAKLRLRFSTQRKRANQSPKESIEQGLASCTGLSVVLSDACRSVAVPARLAGTPLWTNLRGNHTWVEVWDGGWHFVGAAEPDPNGLDHAWFAGDASRAKKDSPAHAIYAASFRRTGLTFPLVWAPDRKDVHAENVTDRYAGKKAAGEKLTQEQLRRVEKEALKFFTAGEAEQAGWQFDPALDCLLASDEEAVRRAVWEAYRAAPIHAETKKDFEQNQVRSGKHLSPYTVKKVGKRPAGGWPLVIAMHGGGGVPKAINDSQWEVMQRYYKDQDSVPGYQYLALRAPNDTWNGFYDDYVPPLVVNLIRQFVLLGDVDPDKVFLIGYSHGGYGAFFIGPKIPDRFAAIHASAAAPTDGAVSPATLRNTRFTYMVGEKDNAYGRRQRCEAFDEAVRKLRRPGENDYPVELELKKGHGHVGLPDRDKIREMYPFTRNPVPRNLTWEMTDSVVADFFWLSVGRPTKGGRIDARIADNTVEIAARGVKEFDLGLDGRLAVLGQPLRVSLDGETRVVTPRPSLRTLCRSMARRGDPRLACTASVRVDADRAAKPEVFDVWPGKVPGEDGKVGEEKFLEQKPGETPVKRLTNVTKPTITVYRPAKNKDTRTAVLICPGGGYHILAWDLEGEEVAAWLNGIGVTGIVLKYRVPRRPGQPGDRPPPGPLQDAQRALSLVRGKATGWGIDPDRIGILGFSAGGHLAASASTNFDKRAYEPADEIDKTSCRPDFTVLIYPAYLLSKTGEELAEDIRVRKECPPTIFIHAADDPIKADNSVQMFRALRRAGVSAELHVYASGGHGFGLRPSKHPCSAWPQRVADWMRSQGFLEPKPAR